MERFLTPSAVIVALFKEIDGKKCVLLQRRQNTGFADGSWDLSCSGHVERGETMTAAAVREAKEELGVNLCAESLRFAVLVHKRDKEFVYINPYFICTDFDGEPQICEPEKCSEMKWFDIENLPEDLIDDRRRALTAYLNGERYIEYGWE